MVACANTSALSAHQTSEAARHKLEDRITARLLREIDYDIDAFAEAAAGFIPDDFYTREAIRDQAKPWATQAKRDATIGAVRALQAIHRTTRMGGTQSANELAIGNLLISIIDAHVADSLDGEIGE